MTQLPSLLGLVPEDLVALAHAEGLRCDLRTARRVIAHVIADSGADPNPRGPALGRALRAWLETGTTWQRPVVEERVVDPDDNSVRYLFRAADGVRFEAVRIGLEAAGRFTVCLSSQAGCAMACDFCATGRLGLVRNLTAAEIVGQLLVLRDEAPGRVSGAVFMGQGEPFHNYDEVIRAARVLSNPCGAQISKEAITISTVGLVDKIRRYTSEGHRYRLIVSLTSTDPALRRQLLPVAGKLPLEDLVEAMREHAAALRARSPNGKVGRRLTVAWVLMGGVNHDLSEIEGLRERFGDLPIQLNLIDVNDARPDGYRRATDDERKAFLDGLRTLQVPVIRRHSVGRKTHAACGMLASQAMRDLAVRDA